MTKPRPITPEEHQRALVDALTRELSATLTMFLLERPELSEDSMESAFGGAILDARVYWHDAQREGVDA